MSFFLPLQLQNNCSCNNRETGEERCEEDGGTELYQIGGRFQLRQRAMANTISNMKMTNPIKGLVSKRRKRFTADGFDLDLTCKYFHLLRNTFTFI